VNGPVRSHPFERDWTVGPWEIITETLLERGITPSQFALQCSTSLESVARLLDGRDRIGIKWARLLNTHLGVSEEFWLALQKGFDDDLAKGRTLV
jgi:plasmid maintenance system antidote protein VapI